MAGTLDYYGYKDEDTALINAKTLEEWKQSAKDREQDEKIKRNYDDNTVQQSEIDRNSLINDAQIAQINDLYEKIEHIPSGGTITDFDMGDW
jgi:hypothetical protein